MPRQPRAILPLVALLALAAVALLPLQRARAAESGANLGGPAGSIVVPPKLDASDVRAAAISAFRHREWTVQDQSADQVTGVIRHRGRDVTLTIKCSSNGASFFCAAWKIDGAGTHLESAPIDSSPVSRWIANIKQDMGKYLGAAAAAKS